MKSGDLRQFRNVRGTGTSTVDAVSEKIFMILSTRKGVNLLSGKKRLLVTLLVDGRIESDWPAEWVFENSEVASETG